MKTIQIILCICLGSFSGLKAQNDLSQLIRQALEYHPLIKEQGQSVQLADHKTQLNQSAYLPQVSLDGSYNYVYPIPEARLGLPTGGENGIKFQPENNFQTSLTLNQMLYDFGKTASQVQKSKLEKELSVQGLSGTSLQLAYQISQLYFSLIYLQKAMDVQKAQIQLLQENEDLIANKIEDGDEIEYNLIATQVRRKNAEIRLDDLENQFQRQIIQLQNLTGTQNISMDKTIDFQGILPEISNSLASENNSDIKISRLREEIAFQELKTAQKNLFPYLGLQASAGFKNGIQPDIYDFRFNYLIGLRLSVPVFTGLRNQSQIEIGKTNLQLRKHSTENQELIVKTGFEQAYQDFQTAQEKLAKSNAQVEQANYALELAEVRYENGIITNLDVLSAQTALQEAQLNQVNYAYQSLLAKLEWHRLSGTIFWE
ncbi:MAG: TolC family protein [Microscillaceae bacterium]|nr:TolC family protein [Microscillaceae bacterium]